MQAYIIEFYHVEFVDGFGKPTHTTGVTNAHGPTPKPTAFRSPTCSLPTALGSSLF